jgi:hypothetical protein
MEEILIVIIAAGAGWLVGQTLAVFACTMWEFWENR